MKVDKEYALKSLNKNFSHLIHPIQRKQGQIIKPKKFEEWLAKTRMTKFERSEYYRLLQGLKGSDQYTAVLVENVKVQGAKNKIEAVLLAPSKKLKKSARLVDLHLILSGTAAGVAGPNAPADVKGPNGVVKVKIPEKMEMCHWNACFCANPKLCSCLSHASQKGSGPCPPNSCQSAKDCGDGSSDTGDDTAQILEKLFE